MIFVDYKSRTTSWEDPRIKDLIKSGPKVPYSLEYNEKSEVFKERIKHKYATSPGSRFEINGKIKKKNAKKQSIRLYLSEKMENI